MNNPLQKYFRKASVYFKLPSGDAAYSPDVLTVNPTGEHAVFSMTALDEITARTPDALFNGTAMVEIIQSCIPDIKDAWQLKTQDLDAVMVAIRLASGNGKLDISSQCPSCENLGEYTLDLAAMLSSIQSVDFNTPLVIDDLVFQLRSPVYEQLNGITKSQFEIQRSFAEIEKMENEEAKMAKTTELVQQLTFLTMKLLSYSIVHIRTADVFVEEPEYILDFLKNCDRRIYNTIRDYVADIRDKGVIKPLKIACQNCSHEYSQSVNLNLSDFFE